MKILILGINYAPEPTSVAPFTTGLAEHLAAEGHLVQVITTFPYYPEWKTWREYRGKVSQKEVRNGVRVHRIRHFVPGRPSSLVQRLLHDFSFAFGALGAGLIAGEFDVIYCSSPPPAVAVAGYALSKMRRVPYTIKLTDLASDAALATGIIAEGRLVRLARAMEDFVYSRSEAVFCLCEAFRCRLMERGISPSRLLVIPDWGDTERIRPVVSDGSFRDTHGISARQFVALHAGNMGKKQDLMNLVRAAELTCNDPDLTWLIVGQGEEWRLVETEIARKGLTNIRLLPLQPADQLCQMYAAADVLVLNQKAAVRDAVIPSKLLTYMSAGRPVLAAVNAESEAARLVGESQCGVIVRAEDPEALMRGVLSLRGNPGLRKTMGDNGRTFADENFTKVRVLDIYDAYFGGLPLRKKEHTACSGDLSGLPGPVDSKDAVPFSSDRP